MSDVVTYFLEMNGLSELNEKTESNGLIIQEAEIDCFEVNRFLYQYVGAQWEWTDKLTLPDEDWKHYVEDPNLRTWIGYYKGSIAGYFELLANPEGDTEIQYFGLTPPFVGKGYGGYFLSQAIKAAWAISSTKRLWLHTCSLDHPSALANYQARGFKIYKTAIGIE